MVRFCSILMTTVAAFFGALPIAVGYGAGAEARRPLGFAGVGGSMFPQRLTLFVTPVVYTHVETLQNYLVRIFYFLGPRTAVVAEKPRQKASGLPLPETSSQFVLIARPGEPTITTVARPAEKSSAMAATHTGELLWDREKRL